MDGLIGGYDVSEFILGEWNIFLTMYVVFFWDTRFEYRWMIQRMVKMEIKLVG